MSRHASREERRGALLRAQQHGLNIRMIANAVVKPLVGILQVSTGQQGECRVLIISVSQFKLKSIGSHQNSKRNIASSGEDYDEIVRSLEWLTFVEETYPDALDVANIVLCWMYSKCTLGFSTMNPVD